MHFRRLVFSVLCCLALASLVAACSFDRSPGSSFAGQVCFEDGDCAEGLTCRERRCRPISGATQPTDVGTDSDRVDTGDDTTGEDTTGEDTMVGCEPGERRCISQSAAEFCTQRGVWNEERCSDAERCVNGECTITEDCVDSDGDGYGGGAPGCPDCNERNPEVNPGADEICDNGQDDNCNGAVDEGCQSECCPGGCANNEICSVCECVPYEPEECTTTGQPCSEPGQFVNGFFCSDDFFDQPRCVGVCDTTADDPDSTCPQDGTVCSFGQDQGQGICLEGCFIDRGCSTPGFGCLPLDGNDAEGICVPIDEDNEIGDSCDPDQTFACEEGALCLEIGPGGPTCQQACRPFAEEGDTDCDTGHCLAFSPDLGFCQQDTPAQPNGSCDQNAQFQMCGEDARVCIPLGQFGGAQCLDMCRLDRAEEDCGRGQRCREADGFDGVGFCVRRGGF